ncbi:THO complex subunit 6 isoform X2 [Impatiens glandulifera]|uniref:THO complex subunit 6 isoform X2 n=1 Tax=Impatiens glandulifera TaxID=253017 RepID=UPI001FB0C469|nr:THO complex subunit 6 isoform X2 [Impatiens glandulifera]
MTMGGDWKAWDEDAYRTTIIQERESQCRTVFRTAFAPSFNPNPDIIVAATSGGSIATYSISSCLSPQTSSFGGQNFCSLLIAEPRCLIQGHCGPTYDVKFYGDGDDALLFSCGDDGRIRGWRWRELSETTEAHIHLQDDINPILDLVNPQHKGPWGALSPIPENNAIAVDTRSRSIFAAAGDSCAYCWDVEKGEVKMVFKGHSDYLHCILTHNSGNQIITGSEDGTARLWDCRTGKCIQVIDPGMDKKLNGLFPFMSSIALDNSENWLVCGNGRTLTMWSLLARECITRISTNASIQDLMFTNNQVLAAGADPLLTRYDMNGSILSQIQCAPQSVFSISSHPSGVTAVAGYGGLVDVISPFGSHFCSFRCGYPL